MKEHQRGDLNESACHSLLAQAVVGWIKMWSTIPGQTTHLFHSSCNAKCLLASALHCTARAHYYYADCGWEKPECNTPLAFHVSYSYYVLMLRLPMVPQTTKVRDKLWINPYNVDTTNGFKQHAGKLVFLTSANMTLMAVELGVHAHYQTN